MNTISHAQDFCKAEVAIERILPCREKSKCIHRFFYDTSWDHHPIYKEAMDILGTPLEYADYTVDLYTDYEYRKTFYLGELGYRILMKQYKFSNNDAMS
ncbi:hypothetical protein [Agarilytica rhodophyticola]|uniref:hypothetical protein n=1 Tax=Agarilytica rhodophyticola TaxID=1737490 RepID=UPI000B3429D6|nr:hypothetical protein [Agarilytica rhodophyticola]